MEKHIIHMDITICVTIHWQMISMLLSSWLSATRLLTVRKLVSTDIPEEDSCRLQLYVLIPTSIQLLSLRRVTMITESIIRALWKFTLA